MSCRSKVTVAPCIAIAFSVALSLFANPVLAAKGWVLEQRSPAGRQVVSVCPSGMRVAGESLTFSMTAPGYDAKFWNTKTKHFIQISHKEWQEKYVSNINRKPQLTGEEERIGGLKCSVYYVPNHKNPRKAQRIWISKEINLPSKFSNMMLSWLRLPENLGVPVRVYSYKDGKLVQKELDTVEHKKSDLQASLFSIPAGYSKVKSLVDIWDDPNMSVFEDASGILKD